MKKVNSKGFTLIELLAVITIMGILMIVAIPAVTRTIENSRKDTFIDTVKQYVNGAKNMWAADNLTCQGAGGSYVSSAVPAGMYFIRVDSSDSSMPQLLEQGGKSPWGSRDMKGYIQVVVDDATTRKVTYYPIITDGVHGINVYRVASTGEVLPVTVMGYQLVESDQLKRGDIVMSNMEYIQTAYYGTLSNFCVEN